MKALQTTRERTRQRALPKVDLSLAKAEFSDWLDKATDKVFFSSKGESFITSFMIFSALYILIHLVIALSKGWLKL